MVKVFDIPNPAPGKNATSVTTTGRNSEVKIRMEDPSELGQQDPETVHTMLARTVLRAPDDQPALLYKARQSDPWTTITYQEYYDLSCAAAKAFIKLGVDQFDAVCILGFNSPEWFISSNGAIFARGLSCGVYATNGPETCQYIAENSGAVVFVVENEAQMNKILSIKSQLPKLKAIIQYKGTIKDKKPFQYEWKELIEMGRAESDAILEQRLRDQLPNQCCTLIYTSGTTGFPKGVMLSHDNLTWTARWLAIVLPSEIHTGASLTYLPLSHIAAQICDIYLSMINGNPVYFAQPDALRGSLGQSLKESRPTLFLGVPRVWEKIREAIIEKGKSLSALKRSIASVAKYIGYYECLAHYEGRPAPWGTWLARTFVLDGVKTQLGLDRCACYSAAAPMSRETMDFFMGLGIPVHEVYGMSETTGPQLIATPPHTFKPGSVGKQFPGSATRLISSNGVTPAAGTPTSPPSDQSNSRTSHRSRSRSGSRDGGSVRTDGIATATAGEVCMSGRNICMGYLNEPEKTAEVFTTDGWLRSGDVGYLDDDGYMFITGRIKEIIITSGGENVAPIPMEDRIKQILPVISNAVVIGDKRKYLTILLTFKTELDENQAPLDTLAPNVIEWAKSLDSPVTTVTQVLESQPPELYAAIDAAIKELNTSSVSRATHVQKFNILPRDFSIAGGELGPTLKLRRFFVENKYHDAIEQFYVD